MLFRSKLNLFVSYDIIVQNPYETENDKLQTIEVLLRTPRPFTLRLHNLRYYPGTELTRRAIKDKIPDVYLRDGSRKTLQRRETIDSYIRMSAVLPPILVHKLLRTRNTVHGRTFSKFFYFLAKIIGMFSILWMIYRSCGYNLLKTIKLLRKIS